MLNRRFLRIKAFQSLYSFYKEDNAIAPNYRKRLLDGLDKSYNLFIYLLAFPVEFRYFLEEELESQKAKYIPSGDSIRTLQTMINNPVIESIASNSTFSEKWDNSKLSWNGSKDLFRLIWNDLRESDLIRNYATKQNHTYAEHKEIWLAIFEILIADSELFNSYLEENFLNWEDDQVLVLTTLQKTIQLMKPGSKDFLPEKHKDEEEDIKFLKNLFDLCIQHNKDLSDLIAAKTKNWEQDRIAQVDLILMKMALCELLYFPFIPVKVSINEYLELAKLYSTPNSHGFINGILDKIQIDLKKQDKIVKLGRGLVN